MLVTKKMPHKKNKNIGRQKKEKTMLAFIWKSRKFNKYMRMFKIQNMCHSMLKVLYLDT